LGRLHSKAPSKIRYAWLNVKGGIWIAKDCPALEFGNTGG
jgi:hypothetical protein